MKSRTIWVAICVFVLLSLVLASCAKATTTSSLASPPPTQSSSAVTTTLPPPTTTITTANWWDKFGQPQYGGTITVMASSYAPSEDRYNMPIATFAGAQLEPLWCSDWKADRNVGIFQTTFTTPDYIEGCLAESWESTDPQTLTVKLRQGVHWQNKAPVNGREFTSDDVVAHYDRVLGTGHGFTAPDPAYAGDFPALAKVTAIDKYTVQFEFKYPTAAGFISLLTQDMQNYIEPPEWVALGGPPSNQVTTNDPLADWHNAVGTGAWMLTDVVSESSLTYTKNPSYWGTDERYPQNKIPYADTWQILIIPDMATAMSAVRTGKIDLLNDPTTGIPWQQAKSLAQTNPELIQGTTPMAGQGINVKWNTAPFSDIRVRQALQLAIDNNAIAQSHYGGTVDGTPCGLLNPIMNNIGWGFAYNDWPQSLKDEYSYNPTKAKQLLADAGYPNGFQTNIVAPSIGDEDLMEIIKAEFANIGVDMEIQAMDMTSWQPLAFMRNFKQLNWDPMGKSGQTYSPLMSIMSFQSSNFANFGGINDTQYDDLVNQFNQATTMDEAKQIFKEADQYALENHFAVITCPSVTYSAWQPSLKGYSNEYMGPGGDRSWWAKVWVTP